jgi:ArsR family transcriptional regulator
MKRSLEQAMTALRAAAEPTRLRLLALLDQAELTVGEICGIVGQSQPRVSRHLKLLCDAELLDRFREHHFVYYRAPVTGPGREMLDHVLSLVSRDDEVLARDRSRLERVIAERVERAPSDLQSPAASLDQEDNAEVGALVLSELGSGPVGRVLDIGTGAGHLLKAFAPVSTRAIGIDRSSEALRLARSNVHGAGFSHCEFQRGDMYDLPFSSGSFDTIAMDCVLAHAEQPFAALSEAVRTLDHGGRLIVVDDFDALSDRWDDNPITRLRQWFEKLGLRCERVRPVDTHGTHLLVAIARRNASGLKAA